jgi:hypothetical protein
MADTGRPSKYTEELLAAAREYTATCSERGEVIPSIEGFALHIGISRETVYAWLKDEEKAEFSDIVERILLLQARTLANNGLTGVFNSSITKLILSKHGYSDKQEVDHTTGGQPLYLPSEILTKNNLGGSEPSPDGDRP